MKTTTAATTTTTTIRREDKKQRVQTKRVPESDLSENENRKKRTCVLILRTGFRLITAKKLVLTWIIWPRVKGLTQCFDRTMV